MDNWKPVYFVTAERSLIVIRREVAKWSKSGYFFQSYHIPSFRWGLESCGGVNLKEVVERLKVFYQIEPLVDLGDFVLYSFSDPEEGSSVSVDHRHPDDPEIKARDVPVGTVLVGDALDFFQMWKGEDAVNRGSARLLK